MAVHGQDAALGASLLDVPAVPNADTGDAHRTRRAGGTHMDALAPGPGAKGRGCVPPEL